MLSRGTAGLALGVWMSFMLISQAATAAQSSHLSYHPYPVAERDCTFCLPSLSFNLIIGIIQRFGTVYIVDKLTDSLCSDKRKFADEAMIAIIQTLGEKNERYRRENDRLKKRIRLLEAKLKQRHQHTGADSRAPTSGKSGQSQLFLDQHRDPVSKRQ